MLQQPANVGCQKTAAKELFPISGIIAASTFSEVTFNRVKISQ